MQFKYVLLAVAAALAVNAESSKGKYLIMYKKKIKIKS